jgi:hypothetical protein
MSVERKHVLGQAGWLLLALVHTTATVAAGPETRRFFGPKSTKPQTEAAHGGANGPPSQPETVAT